MILRFHGDYGRITLPSSHQTNGVTLTNALINVSGGGSSYAWDGSAAINQYCSNNNVKGTATWAVGALGIETEIDNNRPAALYGALSKDGGITNIQAHAVVVFGYQTNVTTSNTYFVHYGHENYSNVTLYILAAGSNFKFKP